MVNPLEAARVVELLTNPDVQQALAGVGPGPNAAAAAGTPPVAPAHAPGAQPVGVASGIAGLGAPAFGFSFGQNGLMSNPGASMTVPSQMYWNLLQREASVKVREDIVQRQEWANVRTGIWEFIKPAMFGAALVAVLGFLWRWRK